MPTLAKPTEQLREYINIDDFSDEEIVDLIEGKSLILTELTIVETFDGNYDASQGQERITIFKRNDGKLFRYIWMVNLNDNYYFPNVPSLEQVFSRTVEVIVYE
jgi:hypothetical protein